MARTEQAVQAPNPNGAVALARTQPHVDHMKYRSDGSEILIVENATAGSINVTVKVPASRVASGITIPDKVIAVPVGVSSLGPFAVGTFRRAESESGGDPGMIYVDFSAQANVKLSIVSHA